MAVIRIEMNYSSNKILKVLHVRIFWYYSSQWFRNWVEFLNCNFVNCVQHWDLWGWFSRFFYIRSAQDSEVKDKTAASLHQSSKGVQPQGCEGHLLLFQSFLKNHMSRKWPQSGDKSNSLKDNKHPSTTGSIKWKHLKKLYFFSFITMLKT